MSGTVDWPAVAAPPFYAEPGQEIVSHRYKITHTATRVQARPAENQIGIIDFYFRVSLNFIVTLPFPPDRIQRETAC